MLVLGSHVNALEYVILILSQPVFADNP